VSGPVAFEWRTTGGAIPRGVLYECADCGRRFANKGWHAEACGSPNFHRVTESRGRNPEETQTTKGTE